MSILLAFHSELITLAINVLHIAKLCVASLAFSN